MGILGTPQSVLTGKDGSGNDITLFQWDFSTYAQMHGFKLFVMLLAYLFLGSIYAPLITLLLVRNFTGGFKLGYLMVFLFAGYFIYDVSTGGLMLNGISLFCDDWIVALIVGLNYAAIAVCLFLMFFGALFAAFIRKPIGNMTEEEINELDDVEKSNLAHQYVPRYIAFLATILLIALFGYLFSISTTKGDNWVNKRLKIAQTAQVYEVPEMA